MAPTNQITKFVGTIKESKRFLSVQPTQIGKQWVSYDRYGKRIYLI